MAILTPYIPTYITVHLGAPSAQAENVTLSFHDYVKNVACSEIYPTWEENALRANILAITSFALNRVYTEFYRSRGYAFDITSSTAFDQAFVNGRNYFANVTALVDELFDDYIRRVGFVEPLAAKFCNGTTVTCEGLSQWGSQYLARQGNGWLRILKNYYGENIEIVTNAPKRGSMESYPGTALRQGSRGRSVALIQRALNRISQNFPAIPKLRVDGIFGANTENSVRAFQNAFSLDADGIVGRITWYAIERVFAAVLNLSELYSQGLRYEDLDWDSPEALEVGDRGDQVRQLQYMLSIVAQFVREVPSLAVDGIFGPDTRDAVLAFQGYAGLPRTGRADEDTWNRVFDQFAGIESSVLSDPALFPSARSGQTVPSNVRARLTALGYTGGTLSQALRRFQADQGLAQSGQLTAQTAQAVTAAFEALDFAATTRMTQYPGTPLSMGSRDR